MDTLFNYHTDHIEICTVSMQQNFVSVTFPGKVDMDQRAIVTLDGTKDIGACNRYQICSERKRPYRFSPEEMLCIIESLHQKQEELKRIKENILNLLK